MRSFWCTQLGTPLRSPLARAVALVCAADTVVGVAFGAITVSQELPRWLPMALSVLVFAGAAQFLFVGVVAAGGNPLAAVAAGLLVNARLVPLGLAVGDLLGPGWLRRLAGAHLLVDETVAFASAQPDPYQRRTAYWACGIALFACWNLGVLVGALGGSVITDTAALGLDAAFPAVLLALVLPALNDPWTRRAALSGAGVAVLTGLVLPAGLPVLLALSGLLVLLTRRAGSPPKSDPAAAEPTPTNPATRPETP
jgi:4-azaleucine resistance transporter AzlC